jgi:hypothetical protein
MRDRAQAIIDITDRACHEHLDDEYGLDRAPTGRAPRPQDAMLEQHPMAWIVEVDGLLVDARMMSPELQAEAARLGLIPDLDRLRAAA